MHANPLSSRLVFVLMILRRTPIYNIILLFFVVWNIFAELLLGISFFLRFYHDIFNFSRGCHAFIPKNSIEVLMQSHVNHHHTHREIKCSKSLLYPTIIPCSTWWCKFKINFSKFFAKYYYKAFSPPALSQLIT